jgi:hypothetical protein
MSEREPDGQPDPNEDDIQEDEDFARKVEQDPSTAGPPDEPTDDLRGG